MSAIIPLGIGPGSTITNFTLLGFEANPVSTDLNGPSQLISLGIGSPARIDYLLLLGLSAETAVVTPTVSSGGNWRFTAGSGESGRAFAMAGKVRLPRMPQAPRIKPLKRLPQAPEMKPPQPEVPERQKLDQLITAFLTNQKNLVEGQDFYYLPLAADPQPKFYFPLRAETWGVVGTLVGPYNTASAVMSRLMLQSQGIKTILLADSDLTSRPEYTLEAAWKGNQLPLLGVK